MNLETRNPGEGDLSLGSARDSRAPVGVSPNGSSAVALVDLTVPQLAEAFKGLDRVQQHHERLSGICAIMKGLVLCEAKAKLPHGEFMSWVKENFPKSHKTAGQYKRLAEEFGKLNPRVQFENLRSDLLTTIERLEEFQLDLQHPFVRQVAEWVKGRSAYQLLLELPVERGGDRSMFPWEKPVTPEEERIIFLERAREDFMNTLLGFERIHDKQLWKAPSVTDAVLEQSIDLAREFAREAAAWLRIPKRERSVPPPESFL
jgi:hypothetical protein